MKRALPALVLLAFACGSPARTSHLGPPAAPSVAPSSAPDASAPPPRDPVASLDELAARGAAEAPLMRPLLRVEKAAPRIEVKADRDQCFRAIVASSAPVRAWFEDATGARGDASTSSIVPPRGPVCAKKGDALRLVFDAPEGATVRAVVFTSP